jgi:L-ribulose-5-phosphate 4-epimerase
MGTGTLSHLEARMAVADAARTLFANGVMSHSGHANLSVRVGTGQMLLTVRGHVRGLGPEDLALVRLDRTVLEGRLDPGNAEIVAMHSEVYKARPQAGAHYGKCPVAIAPD